MYKIGGEKFRNNKGQMQCVWDIYEQFQGKRILPNPCITLNNYNRRKRVIKKIVNKMTLNIKSSF